MDPLAQPLHSVYTRSEPMVSTVSVVQIVVKSTNSARVIEPAIARDADQLLLLLMLE